MTLLDLHLGKPLTRGALTLFPIWNGAAVTTRGYDLGTGNLAVSERAGHAVVAELLVTNNGTRPALLLEGELLEGGQQHRVAAQSVVLQPGETVVLPVRCVEEGRWSGGRGHARTGRRAPVSIRAARQQDRTWARVRALEAQHGGGDTHFLGDALRSADDHAAALVRGVKPLPFQSGVLVCIGGQPVQLEVFDSPRSLAGVWKALLHAAAIDALGAPPVPTPGRRARRFLDRVLALAATDREHQRFAVRRPGDPVVAGPYGARRCDQPPTRAGDGLVDLDHKQTDRALGVLLASAAGDALGVPYEFKRAHHPRAGADRWWRRPVRPR